MGIFVYTDCDRFVIFHVISNLTSFKWKLIAHGLSLIAVLTAPRLALKAATRLRVVSDLVPIFKATTSKATRLQIYCTLWQ